MIRVFVPAALSLLCACATQKVPVSLLGDHVSPDSSMQTIVIEPDTRWVNVTGGDTVRFIADGKEFAWAFNVGMNISSFELNRVAPPGMLSHRVVAYVAPDPRYIGP